MSLKGDVMRRLSLDECTREYLEMGMDLTDKRKRYFSFHEKALANRNRDRRPVSVELSDADITDDLDATDSAGAVKAAEASASAADGAQSCSTNQLSVNNYKEMVKQCLLDSAKAFTHGFQLLRDVEESNGASDALNRCPPQLRNLALLWAGFVDKCDVVEALVGEGADANYRLPHRGYGAAHVSALNGCVRCLRLLLDRGCDPNGRADDMSALHFATFTDSVDAARVLVERGCRLDGNVLHSAVKSRAIECVRLLLSEYQVDANALDPMGYAAVHICADRGFADCMRVLLGHSQTLVNLRDRNECTALHAACESAHVECVQLLVDRGAYVHAKNGKQQTPVHVAARAQSVDCIDRLVRAGADVNARDIDDRTPLHAAISVKTLNVCLTVDTLLGHQAKVNVQDRYGFTPLHIAALSEVPECVESLLAKGGNVCVQTYGGISALNMIVRKVPSCVPAVAKQLDSAVTSSWTDGFKRGPEIQLRFKYLLNGNTFGEIDLLKCFQEEGQYELLQHPLCQAFLYLKWRKIRKYYLMRLVSLAFFILLYTSYVLVILNRDCFNLVHSFVRDGSTTCFRDNSTSDHNDSASLQDNPAVCDCFPSQVMHVIIHSLNLISVLEGFLKISEMAGYMYMYQYFLSLSNLSEWLVLISVPCISFQISGRTYDWQNHVGAFCVLCAWTNLMVKIGQLPWFDTYVAMYTKVQKEFAKLLLAYICLLIGFSISLCVVFPSSPWFGNPIIGFVKVLVMMAGELDIGLLESHKDSSTQSKLSAYIVYVALLIFVSIILMNLLVGIAVHDIQGLKKTAGLSKVRCQIKLIYYIELFMLRSFWPKSVKRRALVYPSKHRAHMTVKPLNQRQTLPREIIDATRILVKRKKQDGCADNDTYKIQEILKEVRDLREVVENNQKIIKHLLMNANKI